MIWGDYCHTCLYTAFLSFRGVYLIILGAFMFVGNLGSYWTKHVTFFSNLMQFCVFCERLNLSAEMHYFTITAWGNKVFH